MKMNSSQQYKAKLMPLARIIAHGNIQTTVNHIHGFGNTISSSTETSSSVAGGYGTSATTEHLRHNPPPPTSGFIKPISHAMRVTAQSHATNYMPYLPTNNAPAILPSLDGDRFGVACADGIADVVPVTPEIMGVAVDELDHEFFKNRMALVDTFSVPSTAVSGTFIGSWYMHPFQALQNAKAKDGSRVMLTPLEFLAATHESWSGGINWRLQIVGPRDISGRLYICFSYGNNSDDILDFNKAIAGPSIIFDFDSVTREIVFTSEFISDADKKYPVYFFGENANAQGVNDAASVGRIAVYMGSKISRSNATYSNPIEINRWMCGAENFQVGQLYMCPSLTNNSTPRITAQSTVINSTKAPVRTIVPHKAEMATTQDVDIQRLGEKWTYLDQVSITGSTALGSVKKYNCPLNFSTNLAGYALGIGRYFRGTLHVRVTPTSTGWCGGMAILSYAPFTTSTFYASQCTQMDHVLIDFSSNQPVELVCPFASVGQYYVTGKLTHVIQLSLLNKLQFPTTGSDSVDLTLEYKWSDLQVFVPTQKTSSTTRDFEFVDAQSNPLPSVTTSDVQISNEQQPKEVVTPIPDKTPYKRTGSFQLDMRRPCYVFTLSYTPNKTFNSIKVPFNSPSSLFDILADTFGVFRGDFVVTVDAHTSRKDVNLIFFTSPNDVALSNVAAPELGVPMAISGCQPTRMAATTNLVTTLNSNTLPCVRFSPDGLTRIIVPYFYYYPKVYASNKQFGTRNSYLGVWSSVAGTVPVDIDCYVEPAETARFSFFRTIPPLWLDMVKIGSDYFNHFNTFFQ